MNDVAASKVLSDPASTGESSRIPRALNATSIVAIYVALFAAWQVFVPMLGIPAYVLPTPISVVHSLYNGLTQGTLFEDFEITLFETLMGFAIAVVTGLICGALIVEFRYIEQVAYPLIVAFQSIPKLALAPLLLIWIGFDLKSKIAMAALVAFFPMLVNTVNGLRSYDRGMLELFDSLSASRYKKIRYLKLPAAVPFLIAGLDVSFILAMLGAIVGEFVGSSKGLGYTILQLQFQLDTAGVFAILTLLGLIGVAGHSIITALGQRVAFWQAVNIKSR